MENFAPFLLCILLTALSLRLILMPIRRIWKLTIHSAGGFLCLWLLNSTAGFTGILLPINAVTVLMAGFLGIPGIGLVVLLELL